METYQQQFHLQWQHLQNPHVRALVWILTSPGLLATNGSRWQGQIAQIVLPPHHQFLDWIDQLDRDPILLQQALAVHQHRRLGRYAETLLAFFLQHQGNLFAQNLQIHGDKQITVGEFDFLLSDSDGLIHWELATKMYLFAGELDPHNNGIVLGHYLGPNQVDTLALKTTKVFQQQLQLSHHPATQPRLAHPVVGAQALIKGWLFYRDLHRGGDMPNSPALPDRLPLEVASDHCRGYWWTLQDLDALFIDHAVILERLEWLAPAQVRSDSVMAKQIVLTEIQRRFEIQNAPVMLALMHPEGHYMQEYCRGMVVPDQWVAQAISRFS